MGTSWNGQISHKEKDFRIQFQTDDYDKYKKVEKLCQELMDVADKEYHDTMLKEMKSIVKSIVPDQHIPNSCKNCPNHPSNGGSGFCNCTLGQIPVTCIYSHIDKNTIENTFSSTTDYTFETGV